MTITRRSFLAASAGGAVWPFLGSQRASASGRPNLLFVCVDDLNGWIGALGRQPAAVTPNIDRLAREGVLFKQAYCPAPACRPSRESVLRGIYPWKSGVYANPDIVPQALQDRTSIPGFFRKNGYKVLGGGKVFHGSFFYKGLKTLGQQSAPWTDDYPEHPDWDSFSSFEYECLPRNWPLAGIDRRHFDWGPLGRNQSTPDEALADWAVDSLSERHSRPFFMAVGFYKPHLPWHVHQRYFDMIDQAAIELPVNPPDAEVALSDSYQAFRVRANVHKAIVKAGKWKAAIHAYLAAIAFVDEQVGKVLQALEAGPNAHNTHVILWSDNGWHLGEKLHWKKFTLWEEATRVPFIIKTAGGQNSGVCDSPVSIADSFRTLSALCGLSAPDEIDGHDLSPLLSDPEKKWPHGAVSAWGPGTGSIRHGTFRLISYANGRQELFDHRTDPGEWQNLAGDRSFSSIVSQLRGMLPDRYADATRGSEFRVGLRSTANRYRRWVETAVTASDPCDD